MLGGVITKGLNENHMPDTLIIKGNLWRSLTKLGAQNGQ